VIVFSGSSPLSGPLGNTRQFSNDGVTVTASAESLIGNTQPWEDSYLGLYSGGLGVTNGAEGSGSNGKHTVDNIGSNDRVVFAFDTEVNLNSVALTAYGDTDISVYYWDSGAWNFLENNHGGTSSRWVNVNNGDISSTTWAIGALFPANGSSDSFKIKKLSFEQPKIPPPHTVPASVNTLLALGLSVMSLGVLRRFLRKA